MNATAMNTHIEMIIDLVALPYMVAMLVYDRTVILVSFNNVWINVNFNERVFFITE